MRRVWTGLGSLAAFRRTAHDAPTTPEGTAHHAQGGVMPQVRTARSGSRPPRLSLDLPGHRLGLDEWTAPAHPVDAPPPPRHLTASAARALAGRPAARQAILAEKQRLGWCEAASLRSRMQHRVAASTGLRTAQDKICAFVHFVVNGERAVGPAVRQRLDDGWVRYSRHTGQGTATLDVRLEGGTIVDARGPA